MPTIPTVHIAMHAQPGAVPVASATTGKRPVFWLDFDSTGHGATLFLAGKPDESIAYLTALIEAADGLRDRIAAHAATLAVAA